MKTSQLLAHLRKSGHLVLPRPITLPSEDAKGFLVHEIYICDVIPGYRLTVLPRFFFDGASIPRIFWLTTGYPMSPELQASALIHDASYDAELMSQKLADDLLYACLRLDGVGWYRANKIWLGVRIGGGAVWAHHTPQSVAAARRFCSLDKVA